MIEYTSKINSNKDNYTFTINCEDYNTFLQIRDETIKVIDNIIKSKPKNKSSYLAEAKAVTTTDMVAEVITPDMVATPNTVATVNTSDFATGSTRYEPTPVRTYSLKS